MVLFYPVICFFSSGTFQIIFRVNSNFMKTSSNRRTDIFNAITGRLRWFILRAPSLTPASQTTIPLTILVCNGLKAADTDIRLVPIVYLWEQFLTLLWVRRRMDIGRNKASSQNRFAKRAVQLKSNASGVSNSPLRIRTHAFWVFFKTHLR